jgi:hypothetical protein
MLALRSVHASLRLVCQCASSCDGPARLQASQGAAHLTRDGCVDANLASRAFDALKQLIGTFRGFPSSTSGAQRRRARAAGRGRAQVAQIDRFQAAALAAP